MQGRKIIHIDMDCFYAAVEMRERPELRGQPIAVGGGSRRGVVTTCNYEARKFGIHSAMPGFQARERCPELVFLPVRFDLYRAESQRIRRMLLDVTPTIEPLSLDEAYLDVSDSDRYAWDIARDLRNRIRDETGLTASAGIAANKMLAKIASDWKKPDGQFAITPDRVDEFMRNLPVRKLWGIGPKTASRLHEIGIQTCGELQKLTESELRGHFGRWGGEMFYLCRGEDDRQVQPHRIRKSMSIENTFSENMTSLTACRAGLAPMVGELLGDLTTKASDRRIGGAFVKLKFADFAQTTCQRTTDTPDLDVFLELLAAAFRRSQRPVRLIGVGVRFRTDAEPDDRILEQPMFAFD